MRETFRGYYHPTEAELSDWWKEGLFVFDANVLLHLFRYPKSARDELVQLLQMICDQAWIPHQVGLEFHRARLDVVNDQLAAYDSVSQILNEAEKQIADKLGPLTNRHLFLDTQFFLDQLRKTYRELHERLDKLKKEHPDKVDDDATLIKVTELFANRVGSPYSGEKLEEIYKKGQQRYERRIPPGYADEKIKKIDERKYGDLVLWLQVIDKALEIKKPIIFVTDDEKDDWWRKRVDGTRVGPRPELADELQREAGVPFHLYSVADFMKEAKARKQATVSEETVKTAGQIQRTLAPLSGKMFAESEEMRKNLLGMLARRWSEEEQERRNKSMAHFLAEAVKRDLPLASNDPLTYFNSPINRESTKDPQDSWPDWIREFFKSASQPGWAERPIEPTKSEDSDSD